MNRYFWPVLLLLSLAGAAQQPAVPNPQLSTSDKTALTDAEKGKQDAQAKYMEWVQLEQTVANEWKASHPGFHLNLQTFAVEADPKPVTPKKDAPKETK